MSPSIKACAAAALLLAACADEPVSPSDIAPQTSSMAAALRVTLVGADGTSLCNSLPPGALVRIRVVNRAPSPDAFLAAQTITCPANSYTFTNLANGSDYLINVAMYSSGAGAGRIPDSYVLPYPFSFMGDLEKRVKISPAAVFAGRAYFDGRTASGVEMSLKPVVTDYAGAVIKFTSDALGRWKTGYGGVPFVQKGMSYTASCGVSGLGLSAPHTVGPLVFPTEMDGFSCNLPTSPATRWSHRATNVTFTPWDGAWGTYVVGSDSSQGWGLQYPVAPNDSASRDALSSHMFFGGLLFAVDGAIVSTSDWSNFGFECGGTCDDMESTGPNVLVGPNNSRRVTWQMSDAGSADSKGLSLTQTSYDGVGGDYILFKLDLRNRNATRMNVYAGTVNDWDVRTWYQDGHTSNGVGMVGDIAYVAGSSFSGPYMGTVFFGDYSTRANHFFNNDRTTVPLATQLEWLKGMQNNTPTEENDWRSLQSVGPISIAPGARKTVYFAFLAGTTEAEMVANRNAAAAHYASLTAAISSSLVEPTRTAISNAKSALMGAKTGKSF